MAATVSSVWSKPGAWALDSEENEEQLNNQILSNQSHPNLPEPPSTDFPSLAAAATSKPKKKNKAQPLSLAEFNTYSAPKPSSTTTEPKRLTQDELLMLPTGPRERTADELEKNRLGGGFRNYGGDRDRSRVSDTRRENSNRERVDLGPSRADEVDDWSKTKKFNSSSSFGNGPGDRAERREKSGFFNSSRADEVDNWTANKSFTTTVEPPRRERRMGFDSYSNGSGRDLDNWSKKKEERVGGGVDGDTWGRRESNGPNGRPKLNLQPRTLPVVKSESVTPSPTEAGKVKGSNPFGDARPREEVLKEKGKDWKEIDEKLEAVKMKEVSSNGEKSEGFGRRRGFGIGRSESGDEKTVRSWRKPESSDAVSSPTGTSTDTAENSANAAESSAESPEKVPEEN